jgi:hypothetical protein
VVLARHLDRRLDRFRAGIRKERDVGERALDEAPGEALAFRDAVEVRGVPQLAGLRGERLDQMRMGVAEGVDADACRA